MVDGKIQVESAASKNKGECQEWRGKRQFGIDTYTQQRKHLPLGKRWSHKVKERMHSTDVTFRIGPGSKKQLGNTRKIQDVKVQVTWRKAQGPS